jgi:hypothetical protein
MMKNRPIAGMAAGVALLMVIAPTRAAFAVSPPLPSMLSQHAAVDTIISGVPSPPGTVTFVVKVTDPDHGLSSVQTHRIIVTAPPDILVCSHSSNGGTLINGVCVLPGAKVGQNYEGFILTSNNSGGTFSIVAGSLPPGLFMPAQYGASGTIVAGTPTRQGTSIFTVHGTDQEGQALQQTYAIHVGPPPPLIIAFPSTCCPSDTVGSSYFQNFFANGGVQPYAWTIAAGQLPPGLRFTSSGYGHISGIPTTPGTFNFTVRVTDSAGGHATLQGSITIS